MNKVFTSLRDIALAGLVFLLPLYVVFLFISRIWNPVSSMCRVVAGVFGFRSVLGVAGSNVLSVLFLITTWLICGLLVRLSFVAALNRTAEGWLSKNMPGYGTYKALAQQRLNLQEKAQPQAAAFLRQREGWRPAYVVEQDAEGNCVVFLPDAPDTGKGQVLLVKQEQIRMVPSITAVGMDALLKKAGKGLLTYRDLVSEETYGRADATSFSQR